MLERRIMMALLLLTCGAASFGPALADEQCSLELLESSAARAAEVCTAVLNQDEATTASRVEALKIRGRAMQRLDRYDDAIQDYEAGLRLVPEDAELHLRRGWTAYETLRRWSVSGGRILKPVHIHARDLALAKAGKALALRPGYADAYELIGATLSLAAPDKFAEAKAAYDEAVRLDPTNPTCRFSRLILFRNHGLYREALNDADAVLALPAEAITKPSRTSSYLKPTTFRVATAIQRAELLAAVGRITESQQAYDRAVELDPEAITYSRRAAFRLSQVAFIHGGPAPRLDAIQDDIDKAHALDPDYWVTREQQGRVFYIRGEYDRAAPELAQALEGYPINGGLRWYYALTLRKLGRGDEAIIQALTAFQRDPGFMFNQLPMLAKHGYLVAFAPDADTAAVAQALMDAARACMLDEECG